MESSLPVPRAARAAAILYGILAAGLLAIPVLEFQRGNGSHAMLLFLPPAAYAAGLCYGVLALRWIEPLQSRARRSAIVLLLHAGMGLGGLLGLVVQFAIPWPGPYSIPPPPLDRVSLALLLAAAGAMLLGAPLSLLLPRSTRRSEALIVAAFAGAGWLGFMLLL